MINNIIKKKIKNNQEIICAFMRIPEPTVAEALALGGVEMIVIDNEHYIFNEESIVNIIRAAELYGSTCLVRVTKVDRGRICRLLDAGAGGILLADARDSSQVIELVQAVKYFPEGNRGVSTDSRNTHYGSAINDLAKFPSQQNQNTIIGVIVETETAVADLESILNIPELDFVSVGTMDLTYARKVPGDLLHPKVQKLKDDIYKKIINSGKVALDKAFTKTEVEMARNRGITCLYVASDMLLIRNGLKQVMD